MPWPRDDAKLERVQALMAEEDLDALVVRAPDNVLYLSNFLPMKGYDAVVFPREGEPTLIALEPSEDDARRSAWTQDLRLFAGYDAGDPRPPQARALELAVQVCRARGLDRVGLELSQGTQAADRMAGEPTTPTAHLFEAFTNRVDASPLLAEARMLKTEQELERMRLANELAALALDDVRDVLRPGLKESEIAGIWEAAVQAHGMGFQGKVEYARGYALVWSGPGIRTFTATGDRPVSEQEPTLFEIWVCADGYWCDHTKNLVPGELDARYAELEAQLLAVYEAAVAHCTHGASLPERTSLRTRTEPARARFAPAWCSRSSRGSTGRAAADSVSRTTGSSPSARPRSCAASPTESCARDDSSQQALHGRSERAGARAAATRSGGSLRHDAPRRRADGRSGPRAAGQARNRTAAGRAGRRAHRGGLPARVAAGRRSRPADRRGGTASRGLGLRTRGARRRRRAPRARRARDGDRIARFRPEAARVRRRARRDAAAHRRCGVARGRQRRDRRLLRRRRDSCRPGVPAARVFHGRRRGGRRGRRRRHAGDRDAGGGRVPRRAGRRVDRRPAPLARPQRLRPRHRRRGRRGAGRRVVGARDDRRHGRASRQREHRGGRAGARRALRNRHEPATRSRAPRDRAGAGAFRLLARAVEAARRGHAVPSRVGRRRVAVPRPALDRAVRRRPRRRRPRARARQEVRDRLDPDQGGGAGARARRGGAAGAAFEGQGAGHGAAAPPDRRRVPRARRAGVGSGRCRG